MHVRNVSLLTKVEELRAMLVEHFDTKPDQQQLFYRGKQVIIF